MFNEIPENFIMYVVLGLAAASIGVGGYGPLILAGFILYAVGTIAGDQNGK